MAKTKTDTIVLLLVWFALSKPMSAIVQDDKPASPQKNNSGELAGLPSLKLSEITAAGSDMQSTHVTETEHILMQERMNPVNEIDKSLFSRVIDTGKVIIPKPEILDLFPEEIEIRGEFIEETSKTPIAEVGLQVFSKNIKIAQGNTREDGSYTITIPLKSLSVATVKSIFTEPITFKFFLWNKELGKVDFVEKLFDLLDVQEKDFFRKVYDKMGFLDHRPDFPRDILYANVTTGLLMVNDASQFLLAQSGKSQGWERAKVYATKAEAKKKLLVHGGKVSVNIKRVWINVWLSPFIKGASKKNAYPNEFQIIAEPLVEKFKVNKTPVPGGQDKSGPIKFMIDYSGMADKYPKISRYQVLVSGYAPALLELNMSEQVPTEWGKDKKGLEIAFFWIDVPIYKEKKFSKLVPIAVNKTEASELKSSVVCVKLTDIKNSTNKHEFYTKEGVFMNADTKSLVFDIPAGKYMVSLVNSVSGNSNCNSKKYNLYPETQEIPVDSPNPKKKTTAKSHEVKVIGGSVIKVVLPVKIEGGAKWPGEAEKHLQFVDKTSKSFKLDTLFVGGGKKKVKALPPSYSDGKLYLYVDKSKITQNNSTFAVTLNTSGVKTYESGGIILKTDGSAGYSVKEPLQIGPDQTPADIKVNLSGTLPSKGKLREAQICFNEYTQCADADWKPWKSIAKDKMTFSSDKMSKLGISKRGKIKVRIFVERPTAKKNEKKVISQLRTYDSATVKHQTRYETAGRVQDVVIDVGLAGLELQMPAVVAFDITTFPTTLKGWQDMAIKSTPPDISYIKSVTCFNKGGSNSSPQVISIGSKNKDRKLDLLEKGCLQANDSVTLENPVEVTFILQPPAGHGFVTAGENPSLAEIDMATIVIFHCTPVCELKTKTLRFENGNMYTVNENSGQKLGETFDQIFATETSTEAKDIITEYRQNQLVKSETSPFGLDSVKLIVVGSDSAKSKEYMFVGEQRKNNPPGSCRPAPYEPGAGECEMVSGASFPIPWDKVRITTGKYYSDKAHPPGGNAVDIPASCGTPIHAQFYGMVKNHPDSTRGEFRHWSKCKVTMKGDTHCTNIVRVYYGCNLFIEVWHVLDQVPGETEWAARVKDQCGWHSENSPKPEKYKMPVADKSIVKAGDIVAYVDSTGNSHGSHLHYQINFRKKWQFPLDFNWLDPEVKADMSSLRQSKGDCLNIK